MPDLVYVLHVSLLDIEPAIWRRVRVRADIALARLHRVLQYSMGWRDAHPYCFEVGGRQYFDPALEPNPSRPSARGVRLRQIVPDAGMECVYEYDFDDAWLHRVRVEQVLPEDPAAPVPYCLGGARACPPEDCGGIYGYEEYLAALRDPSHPDRAAAFDALGGHADPEWFDLAAVNAALAALRR